MRHAALAIAALACLAAAIASASTAARNETGVVALVADGDTLTLTNGKRVRLVQIDTPELGSGECYSRAARTALLNLVPIGSTITLEADPTLAKTDRYGRLLRYVKRNGVNVNIRLVLDGAAAPYFFGGARGKYADRLVAAVNRAKSARKGLWGACPSTRLNLTGPVETGKSGPPAAPKPSPGGGGQNCHPSYKGACLDPNASDYDCEGGSGNGPLYTGPVQVVGPDVFRLDADGDGIGCE